MAFTINSTMPQGITVNAAYCRVEAISLISKTEIQLALRRYAKPSGVPAFMEEYFTAPYVLTGVNPIQQAYDWLKAQPEFAGATDVLEAGQPQN
jgi:hypothetical protein